MLDLRPAWTLALFATSVALLPTPVDRLHEFSQWCLRPARLPFAWQALGTASDNGEAGEVFARGQQIMQLLPHWTDGHAAFVYRYVLTHDVSQDVDAAAEVAEQRLRTGLAMLDEARRSAGKRESSLLSSAAHLPSIACNQFAGLTERLRLSGGAASIADSYLREAERISPTPAAKEQRLWHAPSLASALLACGAKSQALAVIDDAIQRSGEIRDQESATEWRSHLVTVAQRLRGKPDILLDAVIADQRFEPLLPYLR